MIYYLEDYSEGLTDREKYKERTKELNKDMADIEAEINRIEQHEFEIDNAKAKYKEFLQYIKEVNIDNLTNAIIKKLFSKIEVKEYIFQDGTKGKIIIYHYNFMGMSLEDLEDKAHEKGYNLNLTGINWGA